MPIPQPNLNATAPEVDIPGDEDFEDIPDGMEIDNYFAETVEEIEAEVPPKTFSRTLDVKGKKILKDPLVATLSPKHWKRVTMHTFRSQG